MCYIKQYALTYLVFAGKLFLLLTLGNTEHENIVYSCKLKLSKSMIIAVRFETFYDDFNLTQFMIQ